jgi:tyrosine-protein kinase Etk/Wzc
MDLRKGSLRRRLNLPSRPGLSELLAGQQQLPGIHPIDVQPQLDILQAGTVPPNPSELLSLKCFQQWITEWRKTYDFIILDAPPLLPVTDALVVHPLVDVTLLVVRIGLTERAQLQRSLQLLAHQSKHFVGIISNGLRPMDESYSGYYGYSKNSNYFGEDDNANRR